MTLKELKERILTYPNDTMGLCLGEPFSWRGSYDEVCFSLDAFDTEKENNLKMIERALTEKFYGWKGGEYTYDEETEVHFEQEPDDYSGGDYLIKFLANNHNDTISYIFG